MNIFQKNKNENRFVDKNSSDKQPTNINRRDFLKVAVGVAGIAMIKSIPFNDLLEKLGDDDGEELFESERMAIDLDENEEDMEDVYEEMGQNPELSHSTKDLLAYSIDGDVSLTPEKIKSVQKYWENVHSTEGNKLHKSFVDAFYAIGEYEPELRKIFTDAGVPEKYIYLAIPESYWDLDGKSPVGAVGPYQFMKTTAKSYGLYSDKKKFDYRTDPFKSAKAAAHLLSDLYSASGDWDLALSGYNGGHIWRYLKQSRNENEMPSYEGFLRYIEGKINNIKNELKYSQTLDHVVRSPLGVIAKRYGVTVNELKSLNNIKDVNKVRKGEIIKIPLIDEEVKEKVYNSKIAGYIENLNYPAKFNGIYEAIQKGVATEQLPAKNHSVYITKNTYPRKKEKPEKQAEELVYTVKKGEGWFRIYQNIKHLTKLKQRDIIKYNLKISKRGLREGDKIYFPKNRKA